MDDTKPYLAWVAPDTKLAIRQGQNIYDLFRGLFDLTECSLVILHTALARLTYFERLQMHTASPRKMGICLFEVRKNPLLGAGYNPNLYILPTSWACCVQFREGPGHYESEPQRRSPGSHFLSCPS